MSKAVIISELEQLARILYKNEEPDTYDIPGAVSYWWTCSQGELARELVDFQNRTKSPCTV